MPFTLDSLTYRSTRRIRLNFSAPLGAGAFQAARYTVTSDDAAGTSPEVRGAFLVPDAPQTVELALGDDLVVRARYVVEAVAVPSAAAVPVTASLAFETPAAPPKSQAGDPAADIGAELYGADLVWNGQDLAEDPSGDLATISGLPNAEAAIRRAILSEGLPWDDAYGAKLREFVDGAQSAMPEMIGSVQRAVAQDDRIEHATVTTEPMPMGQALIVVTGAFVGDATLNIQQDVSSDPARQ